MHLTRTPVTLVAISTCIAYAAGIAIGRPGPPLLEPRTYPQYDDPTTCALHCAISCVGLNDNSVYVCASPAGNTVTDAGNKPIAARDATNDNTTAPDGQLSKEQQAVILRLLFGGGSDSSESTGGQGGTGPL